MKVRVHLEAGGSVDIFTTPTERADSDEAPMMSALFDHAQIPFEPDAVREVEAWDVDPANPRHWKAFLYSIDDTSILIGFTEAP